MDRLVKILGLAVLIAVLSGCGSDKEDNESVKIEVSNVDVASLDAATVHTPGDSVRTKGNIIIPKSDIKSTDADCLAYSVGYDAFTMEYIYDPTCNPEKLNITGLTFTRLYVGGGLYSDDSGYQHFNIVWEPGDVETSEILTSDGKLWSKDIITIPLEDIWDKASEFDGWSAELYQAAKNGITRAYDEPNNNYTVYPPGTPCIVRVDVLGEVLLNGEVIDSFSNYPEDFEQKEVIQLLNVCPWNNSAVVESLFHNIVNFTRADI